MLDTHIFKNTDVHIMYMYVSGFIQSCYSCKQMKINVLQMLHDNLHVYIYK